MTRGRELAVDTSVSKFYFDGCEQSVDTRTGEIKTTDDGISKWRVSAIEKKDGRQGSESMRFIVASKNNPCNGFTDFQPLTVKGLIYHQSFIDGRLTEWFTADNVTKA